MSGEMGRKSSKVYTYMEPVGLMYDKKADEREKSTSALEKIVRHHHVHHGRTQ